MRWSYWLIISLILVGIVANIVLSHGWTIWPFIFCVGFMSMVHEAAERNGQGVPPLHVYAFLLCVIAVWVFLTAILSVVNVFVLLCGPSFRT